ncbi:MAG: OmpA family protein [Haliscomenobacteraceae bacterium CHB4]|nr:OmpA family protein [Haliscomenobacteraceae bacterium CHB4]
MKIPLWLIALLFVGYTIWAANYWHNYQLRHCCAETAAVAETTGVPLFRWNTDKPEPDAKFPDWKKALLAKGGQGDTLVITGFYRSGEANGEQLALARAAAIRDMLAPEFPASRVRLAARMVDDGLAEGGNAMESASFSWSKMVLKKEESAVIEADKDVILLFPFNSTERDRDAKVDAYLKQLCDKHKGTAATFNVVGHTDNVGTDEENMALGLARARTVVRTLTENGIAANRIQTSSKGESEPVADNATDEGRQKNRRVVITVNQ